jgi:D-alanyl-D-alanine dipeptidase
MDDVLVELLDVHFIIDMMYARTDNMIGCAIYKEIGYGNKAYMHKDVKEALLQTLPFLQENNLKMRICDAYRPPLAHQKLLEIIPRSQAHFFAETPEKSNHCHGTAVDVCLTDINDKNLIYPTEIDAYEKHFQEQVSKGCFEEFQLHLQKAKHNYMDVSEEAIRNRQMLKDLMESVGFESITHEWWHYNLKGWQNYPMVEWP